MKDDAPLFGPMFRRMAEAAESGQLQTRYVEFSSVGEIFEAKVTFAGPNKLLEPESDSAYRARLTACYNAAKPFVPAVLTQTEFDLLRVSSGEALDIIGKKMKKERR